MNDQNIGKMEETDEQRLGSIALSLSGGGGRAAGFHLGMLAYLDRVNLLEDVSILSSVSGGSHVAAKYALTLKRAPADEPLHDTFRRFYREFFGYLMRANLVGGVFKKLGARPERRSSRKSGRRNAVLALADIYDEREDFMDGARFDVFWGDREIHLKEIILNTTEFKTGLAFRFHKSAIRRRSGNRFVPLPESWARKARLADIVATSSCIPIGLEPIFFPQDFRWSEDEPKLCDEIEAYIAYHCGSDTQGNKIKAVSLMDGGVYDNQGTDSVAIALTPDSHTDLERADMVAARFVRKYDEIPIEDSLGLLIISDTPILNDNIYPAPSEDDPARAGAPGRLTLGHLNLITIAFVALALLMIVRNARFFGPDLVTFVSDLAVIMEPSETVAEALRTILLDIDRLTWNFVGAGMPILVGLYLIIVVGRVRGTVIAFALQLPESDPVEKAKLAEKREQGSLGWWERNRVVWRRWKDLRNLRVADLMEMMSTRLSSTWALTGTIFLNRIRSLGYSLLENRDDLKGRVIKNEIFDIVEQENKASVHAPSAQMLAVAQRASTMETQLWYDDEDQLKDLVATGQFTICYNLLEHIDRLRAARGDEDLNTALYTKASEDWEILKEDPFAFIEGMDRAEGGSGEKNSSTEKPKVRAAGV